MPAGFTHLLLHVTTRLTSRHTVRLHILLLLLCASFQVYPITFVQQPFYLEAAINCSHLISDPLKCLFLPPSHYFCLANSRHRVSSKIFRYASMAFLTPFIYEYFWELCMPPLIYVFENLAKPDTVLKYFSWPKENIFREF